jgi:hypothetical protein
VVSSYECGNELSGYIKCRECLGLLHKWWPLSLYIHTYELHRVYVYIHIYLEFHINHRNGMKNTSYLYHSPSAVAKDLNL